MEPKIVLWMLFVVIALSGLILLYAICKVSSKHSRWEEERENRNE
jgi:hypothetical protein